jgi:hypothetical protein
MKIDGHCHCRQIIFDAEVDPNSVMICHCTDCQMLSGSVFRATIVAPTAHFVLHGSPNSYIKTAQSGNQRRHAFCGNCGTPIYACAVEHPQTYNLRIGTTTQSEAFSPQRQIWHRSAQSWVNALVTVPSTEGQ